jgi:hypothetical protein
LDAHGFELHKGVTSPSLIHIDEKWFYMTQTDGKYYLALDEEEPLWTCKNKRLFISKIIFLATIARPCWDPIREEMWDGKLGISPFTIPEAAKHSSKNRPRGTLKTKVITSVTNKEMADILCSQLVSAISTKWQPNRP